jgi:signal recognition particle GTPase
MTGTSPITRSITVVGSWLVQRRLSQSVTRLKSLRVELAQIDEQLEVFAGDAENQAIRALVSETPGAAQEANEARKHAEAMRRHRQHVADSITELERRQDELLDKLTAGR